MCSLPLPPSTTLSRVRSSNRPASASIGTRISRSSVTIVPCSKSNTWEVDSGPVTKAAAATVWPCPPSRKLASPVKPPTCGSKLVVPLPCTP
jgi:hypothetical protein